MANHDDGFGVCRAWSCLVGARGSQRGMRCEWRSLRCCSNSSAVANAVKQPSHSGSSHRKCSDLEHAKTLPIAEPVSDIQSKVRVDHTSLLSKRNNL